MFEKIAANYPFLIAAFLLSAFIAFVVWMSLRSQMKLRKADKINMTYIDGSKTEIRKSKDVFLYNEVRGSQDR